MPSTKNNHEVDQQDIHFRAVCEEGDFSGPWRDKQGQTLKDAENHRNEGHQEHEIRIIAKQTEIHDLGILKTSMRLSGVPELTPLPDIQKKVDDFHKKMNQIADFLIKHKAPKEIQIKKEDLPLQFYIDKEAVARLVRISMQEGFMQLGVFLGLQNPENQAPLKQNNKIFGEITGCFLGLDKDRNILDCHFPRIPVGSKEVQQIDGEDTWPPPGDGIAGRRPGNYFSLASEETTVHEFFNEKLGKKKKGIKVGKKKKGIKAGEKKKGIVVNE